MFELDNVSVKLATVNARAEIHGEEHKPALDLKFEASVSNAALIPFHPELRYMLFKRNDSPDLVEQVNPDELSALRFPKMSPVKWDWEGAGYQLKVMYGISGVDDIELDDVKIDGFSFAPKEGGSVVLAFRAIVHPESDDIGHLCEFIQQNITISLVSPETMAGSEAQQVIEHAR